MGTYLVWTKVHKYFQFKSICSILLSNSKKGYIISDLDGVFYVKVSNITFASGALGCLFKKLTLKRGGGGDRSQGADRNKRLKLIHYGNPHLLHN